MASKFMVKKDPLTVEIDYVDIDGEIIIVKGSEMKKRFKSELKTLKASFKRPNNKLFNLCINGCIKVDEFGQNYLDKNMFDDKRFRILFEGAIDGDGEKINNTSDVDGMMPELTNTLLEAMDLKIENEKFEALKKKGFVDEKGNFVDIKTEEKEEESSKVRSVED